MLIGSRAFLEDNDITGLKELVDQADRLGAQARTVVWIASDGAAVGIIGISDPIKETTPSAVQQLHATGVKVVMATGDSPQTANIVAQSLPSMKFELV